MRLKNCLNRWLAAAVCLLLSLTASADGGTLVVQGSGYDQQVYQEQSVNMMVKGDLDDNGVVDINDVNAMVNLILGRTTLNRDRADITSDGKIGIADLNTLVNIMLGRIIPPEIRTYTVNGVSFNMVVVEGGTFTMGASDDDSEAYDFEKPAHLVTLSDYSIGETEVTQELWKVVMGSNNSHHTGLQLPKDLVSWDDCITFIAKLNALTGETFRLPTEAEWEYAARGGNRSKGYKYSGSNDINDVAWYAQNSYPSGTNHYQTHNVATKLPNELGIYDMSGNVWEWCSDGYMNYTSEPQTNPIGPASNSRVYRGGCCESYAVDCRVSNREAKKSISLNIRYYRGFRLAR